MACEELIFSKMTIFKFFVPTFEENGIFMLGLVFFIQSVFANRNHSSTKIVYIPIKILAS